MRDPLGAFVPDLDLRLAAAAGPLAGLTLAVKDIFDIAGHVTGCGNPDWKRTHGPAVATAPAVAALLAAGATVVGKTITDELAYSLNGQNHHYGTPVNPAAPGRIPGGSSSGSAAAVAGGLAAIGLGTDTGGSVRIPASFCGIFGIRPTHGRIPLAGVLPLAPSFDTVGWFARDGATLARVGAVLLGEDAPGPPFGRLRRAEDAFALAEPATAAALAPAVAAAERRLGPAEPVAVGAEGGGLEAWMLRFRHLQAREIWAAQGDWIEATRPRFGPEIAARFDWARAVALAPPGDEADARAAFAARLDRLLAGGAVLCLPTAPCPAPPLGLGAEALQRFRDCTLALTCIAGLARLPQVTLPLARAEGLPVGLSLIAGRGRDRALLDLAAALAGQDS